MEGHGTPNKTTFDGLFLGGAKAGDTFSTPESRIPYQWKRKPIFPNTFRIAYLQNVWDIRWAMATKPTRDIVFYALVIFFPTMDHGSRKWRFWRHARHLPFGPFFRFHDFGRKSSMFLVGMFWLFCFDIQQLKLSNLQDIFWKTLNEQDQCWPLKKERPGTQNGSCVI